MQKIRLIYIPVFIFLLFPFICTPAFAVIPSNVYTVDGYVVTCQNISGNGGVSTPVFQVTTQQGSAVGCAVIRVRVNISLNIKIGQIFNSKNTIIIDTLSPPTDAAGKTAIFLPQINDSVTVSTIPEEQVELIIEPDCTKLEPKNVYVLNDCAQKTPTGCCRISITVPAIPNKTYSFCYSGYDIPGAPNQDNCSEVGNTFNLVSRILADIGIKGFEFSTEWTDKAGCNYETGECSVPTAITVASFDAEPGNGKVILKWTTGDETDNLGFNLYRSESQDGGFTKINDSLIPSQAPKGLGASYTHEDTVVKNGKRYFYQLEDVDIYGVKTKHGPVSTMPRIIYEIGN
jgi:hypothetical protein